MGISPSSLVCPLVSFFVQLMLERSFYGCNWEFYIGETFLDVALVAVGYTVLQQTSQCSGFYSLSFPSSIMFPEP